MFDVRRIVIGVSALLVSHLGFAAGSDSDDITHKVNFVPTANAAVSPPNSAAKQKPGPNAVPLVFSAAPRESAAQLQFLLFGVKTMRAFPTLS